ncbi:MAG TPA: arsenite methyltransferase [Planctomycetes bacterium]|nr:arsenite methyltransferase [Planctomycetota bacterium]
MNKQQTPSAADAHAIRDRVRADYSRVAASAAAADSSAGTRDSCCAPGCGGPDARDARQVSRDLGYSAGELDAVPAGSNLGLGCGNPQAIASLRRGEIVLDLGSGAGFDAFLAARQVGPEGRVIGVDMTHAMLERARANAAKVQLGNVSFRLGEIEALPVADNAIDVVISNCVINLSPEKQRVFDEALRVLKPGGRLAVSDVVVTAPLPAEVHDDLANLSACVSGAATIDDLREMLERAGFVEIEIVPVDASRKFIKDWVPGQDVSNFVVSAAITARKPGAGEPNRDPF